MLLANGLQSMLNNHVQAEAEGLSGTGVCRCLNKNVAREPRQFPCHLKKSPVDGCLSVVELQPEA
jgi:hypothetical protein